MNLNEFVASNDSTDGSERFRLENSKILTIDLDGTVLAKAGTMVAYSGDISFGGRRSAEGGVTGFIKEAATEEGTDVMEAEGQGRLYLADRAKYIQAIELEADEQLTVNGEDVLAFEQSVDYEIGTMDSLAGTSAGGFTNVFLSGPGYVAITSHGEPLVLTPPVRTDPAATVAWGGVSPEGHVNRTLSDLVGSSSEETYQLEFPGQEGFIIVQPFEEGP